MDNKPLLALGEGFDDGLRLFPGQTSFGHPLDRCGRIDGVRGHGALPINDPTEWCWWDDTKSIVTPASRGRHGAATAPPIRYRILRYSMAGPSDSVACATILTGQPV